MKISLILFQSPSKGIEDFVMMNYNGHDETTWNDIREQQKYAFICQQRPSFSCETGWAASLKNRKCYKYISSPLPADEANNYCKGLSNEVVYMCSKIFKKFFNCSIYQGSLASIHDSETNSLLNTLSNGSTAWLGGFRVEENESKDRKPNEALGRVKKIVDLSTFGSDPPKEDLHRKLDFSVILLIQTSSAGI